MKFGLVVNPRKPSSWGVARTAARYLAEHGSLEIADSAPPEAELPGPRVPLPEIRADVVVAIGGDGTFLSVLQQNSAPLFALNAGTVGVLAEADARDEASVDAALHRLVEGLYFVEDRMKLAVRSGPALAPDATNEVVVHGARAAKMGTFEIALDGRALGRIRADGVILATPTGSTGYALSALGPVMEPSVDAIVLVAIAPFRAASRALVLDPLHTIRVRPLEPASPTVVVIDGQEERPLDVGESILVYRSPRRARFVRFGTPHLVRLEGKGILPWSEVGSLGGDEDEERAGLPP